jgi:membrane protein implicated in regulation of membrane protease activity
MDSPEWFFLTCAIVGGVVFLLRMVLFFVGVGDADGDVSSGETADDGFQFLSLQGMSAFFMMFGLVGLAMLRAGTGFLPALGGAIGAGLLTVWLVSKIFLSARRLQSDGTLRIQNAVGQEGTVYLSIPADGSGQVQIAVQGSLRIFEARSAKRVRIPTGERVRVIEIAAGNILIVESSFLG